MNIMKIKEKVLRIRKEIKAIRLSDWMWFVFKLKRNEFNPALRAINYRFVYDCIADRTKAKKIDEKLRNNK